jgi:hypothetical protein
MLPLAFTIQLSKLVWQERLQQLAEEWWILSENNFCLEGT